MTVFDGRPLGSIVGQIYDSKGELLTVQHAVISATAAGDTVVIPAVPGRAIYIVAVDLVAAGTVTVEWKSRDSIISTAQSFVAGQSKTLPFSPSGWGSGFIGYPVTINLSAAVAVSGTIKYVTSSSGIFSFPSFPTDPDGDQVLASFNYFTQDREATASRTTGGALIGAINNLTLNGWVYATNGKGYVAATTPARKVPVIDFNTQTITYENYLISTLANAYQSGCLGADGKAYFAPYNASDVAVIDPVTNTATLNTYGLTLTDTLKWFGFVRKGNKIYGIPGNRTDIIIIDTALGTASVSTMGAVLTGTGKWSGGCLAPNGKIYGVPRSASDFLIIDDAAGTATRSNLGLSLTGLTPRFRGACIGPDGKIYLAPLSHPKMVIIDPVTNTAIETDFGLDMSGLNKWSGISVGKDGKLYCIPYSDPSFLVVDPLTQTAERKQLGFTSAFATLGFQGATLTPSGKIFSGVQGDNAIVVIQTYGSGNVTHDMALSPHFNKGQ